MWLFLLSHRAFKALRLILKMWSLNFFCELLNWRKYLRVVLPPQSSKKFLFSCLLTSLPPYIWTYLQLKDWIRKKNKEKCQANVKRTRCDRKSSNLGKNCQIDWETIFPVLFKKVLFGQYERGIASDILPKCIINCTEVCLLKIERGYIDLILSCLAYFYFGSLCMNSRENPKWSCCNVDVQAEFMIIYIIRELESLL